MTGCGAADFYMAAGVIGALLVLAVMASFAGDDKTHEQVSGRRRKR